MTISSSTSTKYYTDKYNVEFFDGNHPYFANEAQIKVCGTGNGAIVTTSATKKLKAAIDEIDNNLPEPYAVIAINALISQHC